MADEVLRTAAELLADLPDNTSQLIQPVNNRNMVVGLAPDIGVLTDDGAFTVPITDGVAVNINALLPSPVFSGRVWSLDVNNAFIPDWSALGVTVVGPLSRLLDLRTILTITKTGPGTDSYSFQYFAGGLPVGVDQDITIDTDQRQIAIFSDLVYDHFTAQAVDLRVTGQGTGDDLNVTEINMRALGAIL